MIGYLLRFGWKGPLRYLNNMQKKYSAERDKWHERMRLEGVYDEPGGKASEKDSGKDGEAKQSER